MPSSSGVVPSPFLSDPVTLPSGSRQPILMSEVEESSLRGACVATKCRQAVVSVPGTVRPIPLLQLFSGRESPVSTDEYG